MERWATSRTAVIGIALGTVRTIEPRGEIEAFRRRRWKSRRRTLCRCVYSLRPTANQHASALPGLSVRTTNMSSAGEGIGSSGSSLWARRECASQRLIVQPVDEKRLSAPVEVAVGDHRYPGVGFKPLTARALLASIG